MALIVSTGSESAYPSGNKQVEILEFNYVDIFGDVGSDGSPETYKPTTA